APASATRGAEPRRAGAGGFRRELRVEGVPRGRRGAGCGPRGRRGARAHLRHALRRVEGPAPDPPRPQVSARRTKVTALAALAAAGLLAGAPLARAQAPEAPPPAVVPPSLVDFVEASYPPEAQAAALEAQVELFITIAADGSVTEVEVKTPAGHGFDEAAAEAARRFRFTPARVNGVATPARIGYLYVFELPEAPAPAEGPEAPFGGDEAP